MFALSEALFKFGFIIVLPALVIFYTVQGVGIWAQETTVQVNNTLEHKIEKAITFEG
jgi:hypothetical protein